MNLASVRDDAMQLPPREKVALIDSLWDSLEREELVQVQARWAAESEERIDAFERGDLSAVDGPGALRELRQSLRR